MKRKAWIAFGALAASALVSVGLVGCGGGGNEGGGANTSGVTYRWEEEEGCYFAEYYETYGEGIESPTEITVLSEYEGKPVKIYHISSDTVNSLILSEGFNEFNGGSFHLPNLEKLTLPSTVENIYECGSFNQLKEVHIPDISVWCDIDFVQEVGGANHEGNNPLYNGGAEVDGEWVYNGGADLYAGGEKVVDLVLPETVERVSAGAFFGCKSIESVTINGATVVEDGAFGYCKNLKTVTAADGVTFTHDMGYGYYNQAFEYCDGIESVKGSLALMNEIDEGYDHQGASPKTVEITSGEFTDEYEFTFGGWNKLETVVITSEITELCNNAFSNCSSLKNLTFPNTLKSIGDGAFQNCTSLENITIPDSVESIGSYVFRDCTSLKGIELSEKITEIPNSTFYGCTSLTEITLPQSVTKLGELAFQDCTALKKFTCLGKIGFSYYVFENCTYIEEVAFLGGLTLDDNYLYYSVRNISVDTLRITASLAGEGISFKSIKKLVVQDGEIERFAGRYSDDILEELHIAKTVTAVADDVFAYIAPTTKITVEEDNPCLAQENGCIFTRTESKLLFANVPESGVLTIPDGIKTIAAKLFYENTLIKELIMPSTLLEVANEAFYRCTNLANVHWSNSLHTIGEGAFQGCAIEGEFAVWSGLKNIKSHAFAGNQFTKVDLSTDLETLGEYAFVGNRALSEVTLAEDMTAIPKGLFDECTSLTQITLPSGLESIGVEAFSGSGLTKIDIPEKVTEIERRAFSGCENLAEITLPNGLKTIGEEAFRGCGLTEILLPESLERIGDSAFDYCESLTKIVIPDNVTEIGAYAFIRCSNLQSVTLGKKVETIGNAAFGECENLTEFINNGCPSVYPDDVFYGSNQVDISALYERYENGLYKGTVFMGAADKNAEYIIIKAGTTSVVANAIDGCNNLRFVYIPSSISSSTQFDYTSFICNAPSTFMLFIENHDLSVPVGTFDKEVDDKGTTVEVSYRVLHDVKITDDGFIYDHGATGSKIRIWGYAGSEKNVVVPSAIEGVEVVSVKGYAFANTKIDSVSLPETIEEIGGYWSFRSGSYQITLIHNVFAGSTVQSVSCASNGNLTVNFYAFFNMEQLETVSFTGSGNLTFNQYAFYGVKQLKNVSFTGENVLLVLGLNSFHACDSLKEITLPTNTALNEQPFSGTTILEKVVHNGENAWKTSGTYNPTAGTYTVSDREPIDSAVLRDSEQLATLVMNNSWLEFGSMHYGSIVG